MSFVFAWSRDSDVTDANWKTDIVVQRMTVDGAFDPAGAVVIETLSDEQLAEPSLASAGAGRTLLCYHATTSQRGLDSRIEVRLLTSDGPLLDGGFPDLSGDAGADATRDSGMDGSAPDTGDSGVGDRNDATATADGARDVTAPDGGTMQSDSGTSGRDPGQDAAGMADTRTDPAAGDSGCACRAAGTDTSHTEPRNLGLAILAAGVASALRRARRRSSRRLRTSSA
jgi:MYXO-CTERM domain-containing protein